MDQCVRRRTPHGRHEPPGQDAILEAIHAVEARSRPPLEVLDRDQRTVRVVDTRTRGYQSRPRPRPWRTARPPCSASSVECQCERQGASLVCDVECSARPPQCRICRISRSRSSRSSTRCSSWFPTGSAIRWFLAALCVLALLPPRAMAAPARPAWPSPPKWINPCGMNKQEVEHVEQELMEYTAVTVTDLIQHIVTQSKTAFSQVERFRDEYVRQTFNVGYDEHHQSWKTYKYDWLPNIPKELGERVSEEHLKTQNLESALPDIYQYLQKYAVGLEQIVKDQEDNNGEFRKSFGDVEYKLRSVLCEVQVAMAEQAVMQHPDVDREIMGQEFRDMRNNASYRNLRDWIILRDYMNGLEYVIQLLEYFNRPS